MRLVILKSIRIDLKKLIFWTLVAFSHPASHIKYFGQKHLETGANFLYEHATFLKYHMPLSECVGSVNLTDIFLETTNILVCLHFLLNVILS